MIRNLYLKYKLYFKYKDWFRAYNWLLRLAGGLEKKINKEEVKKDSFEFIVYFLFIKSYLTFKTIRLVCRKGFGFDSGILCRALLENLVNILYISKDPKERAELFLKYEAVLKKREMNDVESDKDWLEKKGMRKSILDNKQKIEREYNLVKHLYTDLRKGWSQKSIREMIAETEKILIPVFSILCSLTHPSPYSITDYIEGIWDKEIIPQLYPNDKYLYEILPTSYNIFLQILQKFNEVFNLGQEKKLKEAKVKHDKICDKNKMKMYTKEEI